MKPWRPRIVITPIARHVCPFCKSHDTYIARPGGAWAVQCGSCGARGSVCDSKVSALDVWNYGVGP